MKTYTINTNGFQDTIDIINDGVEIILWHKIDGEYYLINSFDPNMYDEQFIEDYTLQFIHDFYGDGIEIIN